MSEFDPKSVGVPSTITQPVLSWIDMTKDHYFLERPKALRFERDNRDTLRSVGNFGSTNYHQVYKTHYGNGIAIWSSYRYLEPNNQKEYYTITD